MPPQQGANARHTSRGIYVHIIDKARAGISSAAVQIVILAALFV